MIDVLLPDHHLVVLIVALPGCNPTISNAMVTIRVREVLALKTVTVVR